MLALDFPGRTEIQENKSIVRHPRYLFGILTPNHNKPDLPRRREHSAIEESRLQAACSGGRVKTEQPVQQTPSQSTDEPLFTNAGELRDRGPGYRTAARLV